MNLQLIYLDKDHDFWSIHKQHLVKTLFYVTLHKCLTSQDLIKESKIQMALMVHDPSHWNLQWPSWFVTQKMVIEKQTIKACLDDWKMI